MENSHVQLAEPSSVDALASYHDGVGPGVSKIIHEMERQQRDQHDGEEMKRRTRILYVLLGALLVCVYFSVLRKNIFQQVPSPESAQDDIGGTLRMERDAIELEGKSRGKKSRSEIREQCNKGDYSDRTLKRAYELPFASLFKDTKGQTKYEASDIVLVDGTAYAVCDNSWAISKFEGDLRPFSPDNLQIGDPDREEEDSGFEALFHDDGTFYVLRESILHKSVGDYHSIIEELSMGEEDYEMTAACRSEFVFEGDSKGFEGVLSFRDTSNELVVLGLCEGNHCSEKRKDDRGNGRFVVMKKGQADDGSCQWNTIRTIKIPKSAHFRDYSAATMHDNGRLAISSQEESAIWVGRLLGFDETKGGWDLDALRFDPEEGRVLNFPKNDDCETVYCNIEGIHWMNHETIIAVSDQSKNKQDFRCFEKDQSVHVFVLPPP